MQARRGIGRSLAGFDLTWMLPALVSDDPGARDLMRPYVATYLTAGWPSYDRVAEISGFGRAATDPRRRLQHAHHFDEVASAVSDERLTPSHCAAPPASFGRASKASGGPGERRSACSRFPGAVLSALPGALSAGIRCTTESTEGGPIDTKWSLEHNP